MKNRNADSIPFQVCDIHMPNHSPPTDMKPTCQTRKPSARPAMAHFFERLKLTARSVRRPSIANAPIQHRIAVSVSAAMMRI
ncbi:hypothetical protein D3C87_2082270 [compost metagenome]